MEWCSKHLYNREYDLASYNNIPSERFVLLKNSSTKLSLLTMVVQVRESSHMKWLKWVSQSMQRAYTEPFWNKPLSLHNANFAINHSLAYIIVILIFFILILIRIIIYTIRHKPRDYSIDGTDIWVQSTISRSIQNT